MAGNVGTAKVTIEADFGNFQKDLDTFFNGAGKSGGKALDSGVKQGADSAKKSAEGVAKATEQAVQSVSKSSSQAVGEVGKAAQGAGKAAEGAASQAQSVFDKIAARAGKAGTDSANMYRTGIRGISDSSQRTADQAGRAFSGVADSAGSAGAQASQRFTMSISGVSTAATRSADASGSAFGRLAGAVGSAGTRAAGAFSTAISGVSGAASRTATAASNAWGSMTGAAQRVGQAISSSFEQAAQHSEKALGGMGKKLATLAGGLAAVAGPAAMLKGGFDRLMKIQRAEIIFQNIGLSAEQTKDQMARLTEQVTGTSVSLADAAKYSGMFAQAGVELGKPMDDSIKAFTSLSSIAEGSGVDVGRVLSQIAANGKVTGEDLMQMSDAGINASKYLADSMGMSQADIKKAVSDGKVSFEDFVTAVNSGTGDLAKEMGQTLPAKISNFKTSISTLGAAIVEPMIGPVTVAVTILTGIIKALTGQFKDLMAWFKEGSTAATILKDAIVIAGAAIAAAFATGQVIKWAKKIISLSKGVGAAMWAATGPIGLVVGAIAGIAVGFAILWNKSETFRNFWIGLWDGIKERVSAAWDSISPIFDTISAAWDELTAAFSGGDWGYGALASLIGDGAAENVVNAFAAIGDAVRTAWEWIKKLRGVLADVGKSLMSAGLDAAVALFESLWSVITALFGAVVQIGKAFWDLVQVLAPVLWPILKVIGIVVGGVLVGAFFALMGALKLVAGIVKVVATVIKWLAENVLSPLIGVMGTVASFLVGVLAGAFRILFSVVKTVAGAIGTAVSAVWDFLQAAWESVGVPVLEAIKTGFGAVRDFIVGAWDKVTEAFTAVWGFLQAAWDSVGAPVFEFIKTAIGIFIDGVIIGFKLIGAVFEVIWIALGKAWETFGQPVIDIIVAAFQFWWDGIKIIFGYLQDGWNLLWGWLQLAWDTVGQPVVDAVKNAFQWMWDGVQAIFGWLKDRFTDMVRGFQIMWDTVGRPVVDAIVNGFNRVKDGITNALNWVKDRITDAGRKISELYSSYVQPMVDSVINGFNRVKDTVTGWKDKIVGALSDAGSWLIDTGKNIVQGLMDGIGSLAGSIGDFFLDKIPGWIKKPFKKALGIHSPSRVFAGYGVNIGEGLVNGVKSMSSKVQKATQALADSAGNVDVPELAVEASVSASAASAKALGTPVAAPTVPASGGAAGGGSGEAAGDPSGVFSTAAETMTATAESLLTPMWAQQQTDMTSWGLTAQTQATTMVTPALAAVGLAAQTMNLTQWQPTMTAMNSAMNGTALNTQAKAGLVMNPALNSVGATAWAVLNGSVNPAMSGMQGAVNNTAASFGMAANNIATQWNSVREATAAPARFAIQSVFNDGIVGMWNSVSELLGTTKMSQYPVRFATGGYVRGPGGPKDDKIPALLSNREYVLDAKTTARIGPENLRALQEGSASVAPGVLKDPAMRRGFLKDKTMMSAASRYQGGGLAEGTPAWKALLRGYNWARSRNGRPYVWGGSANGNGGADCSGFMSGIADVILGGNGARQWATMDFPGTQAGAWKPGLSSGFAVGISDVHTAGTIGGVPGMPAVNVESGGVNSRMKFGTPDAAGANDGQFNRRFSMIVTDGGTFMPGQGSGASMGDIIGGLTKPFRERMSAATTAWANSHPGVINTMPGAIQEKMADAAQKKIDKLVEEMMADPGGAGSERWRPMAKRAMARTGFDFNNPAQVNAMISQIQSESSGDPNAVQNGYVDVNTGGNEAVGLLQVIPGTFAAHRDPALPNDRTNPFANMVAALRYYRATYGGDLTTMWGHGHGYDRGGLITEKGLFSKQTTEAERMLSPRQTRAFDDLVEFLTGPGWDGFTKAAVGGTSSSSSSSTRTIEAPIHFHGPVGVTQAAETIQNRLTRKVW